MRRLSCAGVNLAWAYNWPEAGNFDLPGFQTVSTQAPFQPEPTAPPTPSELPDAIDPSMCQDFARLRSQVARSPLRTYMQNFGTWLRESPYQTAIALGALACGCVCAWDGPRLWENLVIAGFSLGAAWLAHFETDRNHLAPNLQSGLALMLAAGVIAGLAVHSGFEGTQVVIGAAAGFAAAAYCGVGVGAEAIDKSLPGISLTWCCAGSSFGAWVLVTWRRPLLACLAPLLGSFLVVSGVGSLISFFDIDALPQQGAPWSVEASILLGPLGTQALTWHCLCVLLAASAQNCGRRALAVTVMIAYVVLVALGALIVGIECKDTPSEADGRDCPEHLAIVGRWQWQLCGCTAWAALAAFTGWRQLGALQVYLSRKLSRRTSRSRSSYAALDETPHAANVESGLQTFVTPGYMLTGGPQRLSSFVHSFPHRRLGTV